MCQLPMSLGLGEGGEQNAPLGRAVIGGLLLATVATLPPQVRRGSRDFGTTVEVLTGLESTDRVIVNPSDSLDGMSVQTKQ